jgi:hypothetical protein
VVDPVALRALAGPAADEAWDERFLEMRAYAAGKGWVEPDGGVLAHIEPGRETGSACLSAGTGTGETVGDLRVAATLEGPTGTCGGGGRAP